MNGTVKGFGIKFKGMKIMINFINVSGNGDDKIWDMGRMKLRCKQMQMGVVYSITISGM